MKTRTVRRLATIAVIPICAIGAQSASATTEPAGDGGPIGLDLPRADSDFWNAYSNYVPEKAEELGVNLMDVTNSQNDVGTLVTNVQQLVAQGAEAIVMAPQDTGAITSTIEELNDQGIPVVSIDTRPDAGDVFMVVRADNRAYGEKACEFLGEQLGGEGTIVEFQGSLSSVNGRDRSEAFAECMSENFPDIEVMEEPTEWDGAIAQDALRARLAQGEVNGIYMQAGGVFLAPTLQLLESEGLLVPPDDPNHIFIVSNDGIPQEFEAIRAGQIDATVSQPADLYAEYGLSYAQAALNGETFEPGETDHDSTIVEVRPGVLEDQLPAPLVTAENVDDPELWGNQVG